MRVLQVISGFCMFTFPYFLVYLKFGVKDNFNNAAIFRSTLLYSLLSVVFKVFLLATGIPELLAKFLFPEKLVLALLDTVSLAGMKFALTSKASLSAKFDHRVLCVGIYWSLVSNLVSCFVVTWKVFKSLDYTLRFYYFALNANLSVIGFLCSSCLVLMYLKSKVVAKELYYLMGAYVVVFPVLGVFSYNEEAEVDKLNLAVFGVQAFLGVGLGLVVRYYYNNKFKVNKKE